MGDTPADKITVAEARALAYRYLGNREHSCRELMDKLQRRGVTHGVAAETVEQLQEEDLVSDLRFAESFTRSRITRYQGPYKIRADLIRRGVDERLAAQMLAQYEEQWVSIAQQWLEKRHSGEWDRKEKARLYRGGCNRGFSHEHMMRALDAAQSAE